MAYIKTGIDGLISLYRRLKRWGGHYFGGLVNRADEHHIFLMSGGLAFSLIICIVPMVLIIFAGLGVILEQPSITNEISNFIDRAIPYSRYAASIKEIVTGRINEFRVYRGLAGLAGIIGLLFASSGLFSSMRTILNRIYKVTDEGSILLGKLRDFGMILLVLLYFLLSTLILPGIDIFTGFARRLNFLQIYGIGSAADYLVSFMSFTIIFVAFFIIYFLIPRGKISIKVIGVSAFWAALLWEAAKQAFGFYITNVASFKKVYGAYSLIIVVVFWLYYTSLIFILGGLIGQLYREWHDNKKNEPNNTGKDSAVVT